MGARGGGAGVPGWLHRLAALCVAGCSVAVFAVYLRTSDAVDDIARRASASEAHPQPEAMGLAETAEIAAAVERMEEAQFAAAMAAYSWAAAAAEAAAAERDAARDSVWDRMAQCETGGNWSMRGSSYSGGVGFMNEAWVEFGGREFAPNAGQATREQQIVVAERIRAAHGYSAWGCAEHIGLA